MSFSFKNLDGFIFALSKVLAATAVARPSSSVVLVATVGTLPSACVVVDAYVACVAVIVIDDNDTGLSAVGV